MKKILPNTDYMIVDNTELSVAEIKDIQQNIDDGAVNEDLQIGIQKHKFRQSKDQRDNHQSGKNPQR
jgi:hypothetical protein